MAERLATSQEGLSSMVSVNGGSFTLELVGYGIMEVL
jgi:hypothetical protein